MAGGQSNVKHGWGGPHAYGPIDWVGVIGPNPRCTLDWARLLRDNRWFDC
jgi:hypothetical protein